MATTPEPEVVPPGEPQVVPPGEPPAPSLKQPPAQTPVESNGSSQIQNGGSSEEAGNSNGSVISSVNGKSVGDRVEMFSPESPDPSSMVPAPGLRSEPIVRIEPAIQTEQDVIADETVTISPASPDPSNQVVSANPIVGTEPVVITEPITEAVDVSEQVIRTESTVVETPVEEVPAPSAPITVPKPADLETTLNETMVKSTNETPSQDVSTIQDVPLSQQGSTNDDVEVEPVEIVNRPMAAMLSSPPLSSGSSRKNRRKASRPIQINRPVNADPDVPETPVKNPLNLESMINAASDITDFCDIANTILGGDDSSDADDVTTTTSSTLTSQSPPHQAVPVEEIAQRAIAQQQNIPNTASTTTPIFRQTTARLPTLRGASPYTQIRESSPNASPNSQLLASLTQKRQMPPLASSPRPIFKQVQQLQHIQQIPQQQQQVIQPQQYIMQQQPVQGNKLNLIVLSVCTKLLDLV